MMDSKFGTTLARWLVVATCATGVAGFRGALPRSPVAKRPQWASTLRVFSAPAATSPAITQARCVACAPAVLRCCGFRIKSRKERIRQLEKELKETRALVVAEEKELKAITAPLTGNYVDSTQRSVVKALGWRITAGAITFGSSMYFTKNLKLALSIVASDFLSKAGTMFIGERVFNKFKAGRGSDGDSVQRSVAKALIWRAIAFVNTATVSGVLSGSAGVASKIASFDAIFKTALMVFYDQFWNRIDWGKELENVDGAGI